MVNYISRKILTLLFTLLFVVLLVFIAFRIIPGNPAQIILGTEATAEQISALEKQLGIDQPLSSQFISFLKGIVMFNFGNSLRYSQPVLSLIFERVGVTFTLALISIVMTVLIGIPLGVAAAKYKGKFAEFFISIVTQLGLAIPSFWAGIILIMFFGLTLKWFSVGGYVPWSENPWLAYKSLLLPAIAISIPQIAIIVRYLRTTMIEQLHLEYVRTAKSKGLKNSVILYKHVLKNALIPVITIAGMNFSEILAGSLVIEQVFSLPGIGRLLITAIGDRDFPLVQGMVIMIALIAIFVNLFIDLAYQWLDPKMK
ncbi:ABC transporter permease [Neobacillus sp. LXY-1]|uniref:ABC transporter permease n=1 Tax=Neobacillus sp. LXY-1 TaxID=3379133 RepID=UPI003EE3D9AA